MTKNGVSFRFFFNQGVVDGKMKYVNSVMYNRHELAGYMKRLENIGTGG
jgi:hypothetical protein